MSKIKNVIAGLGVVTSLGVAMAPLTSYADTPNYNPNTVTAVIETVIRMTISSTDSTGTDTTDCQSQRVTPCTGDTQSVHTTIMPSADNLSTESGHTGETDMYTEITVSTNSLLGYTLTLTDSDNNANLQTSAGATIAPISTLPAGGTNPGWAVRIDGANTWYAMPTLADTTHVITVKDYTPNPAAVTVGDQSKVYYGVAASSSQASGTYTDTVVYTATARI